MMIKTVKFTSNRTDREYDLPACWTICQQCDGDGVHDHPAFSNGITSSERDEWTDEEFDRYLDGAYDVRCDCCKGSGRVLSVDEAACQTPRLTVLLHHYKQQQEAEWDYQRVRDMERRMGY